MHLAGPAAEQATAQREMLLEIVDLKQRRAHAATCSFSA
jgi:hypothetical protein